VFQIEPAVDTGPLLGMVQTAIEPRETTGDLHDRLAELAAGLVIGVVDELEQGGTTRLVQDDTQATPAPRLTKSDAEIDWSADAVAIDRHVRAMQPWPNPFTFLHAGGEAARRLIIQSVEAGPACDGVGPGEVVVGGGIEGLVIGCGGGTVRVLRLQPEGRRPMDSDEFLRGTGRLEGARVGPISGPRAG
jgi:methionyl-tRNA formyltransferase